MSIPLTLKGSLPSPRLERLWVVRPGKATASYVIESVDPDSPADPGMIEGHGLALLTDWKLVRKDANRMPDGYYVIRWTYEAGCQMPGGNDGILYSMHATVMQEPLTSHPDIENLMQTYGGYLRDGQLLFSPQDPTGESTRSGTDAQGNYYGSINPLYNVDSYMSPRVSVRRRKMTEGNDVPTDQLSSLGVVDTPPDGFGFNSGLWLKTIANASQHGMDLEITEEWMSGGIGGWRPIIYDPNYSTGGNA
jgi:hypothetical protein